MKKTIMMTAAFLLVICTQANIITPEENQVWWGYFNEDDFQTSDQYIGTGQAMTLMAGIYIPAGHEQLGKATIDAVRVYLHSDVVSSLSNMKIWISKKLPNKYDKADVKQLTTETLSVGANDFKLSTPYEINNEGFYIGYCATSSTGYFIRSGGTDAPNAFWVGNPEAGMKWTDLNGYGFGKLAFQILVEGIDQHSATVEHFKKTVVSLGEKVNIPITITNLGTATINELSYTITVDGNTSEEETISSLSIPFNTKQTVMVPFNSAESEGTYTYTLTITKINGNINTASQNTATGSITTVKELKVWPRNVLIEEFITEYCLWCPSADSSFVSFMETYPDLAERVAKACHHAGYGEDWLVIPSSSKYIWFYNDGGSTYVPAFMYDRYAWNGKTPVVSQSKSPEDYKSRVEARLAEPSYANITMDAIFNEEMTNITVTCECERSWDFCNTPACITIFLTEDNITAKSQAGATGTFIHHDVLRAVNTTWGDVLSWENDKSTYTYTFNLDSHWKKDNLKVISFISGYDSNDPTNCVVENVAFTAPSDATSVNTLNATDSNTIVTIYSVDGRKLTAPQNGINIIRYLDGTTRKVLKKMKE